MDHATPHSHPPRPLSPREQECLEMCGSGLTSKEIARALDLSRRTIEQHIASATRKLNARNRTHAVSRALLTNIIRVAV